MANEGEPFVSQEPRTIEASTALKDLYLADLNRLEESIGRNEEIGERRFSFFVTIVTAVVGAIVTLWTSEKLAASRLLLGKPITVALVTLLVLGLATYRRMMHRDAVTEEYKRDTRVIRSRYRAAFQAECPGLEDYRLESEKKSRIAESESNLKHRWKRIKQMGYTQTIAIIDGVLLATVLDWVDIPMPVALLCGFALSALLVFHGAKRHKQVK